MCTNTMTIPQEKMMMSKVALQKDKAAYLEACQQAPHLVAAESNPTWFLRHANGDSVASEQQLAQYWMERKATFGDRFLLPMDDLSGNGALTSDDVKTLRTGYLMALPRDSNDRTVLYYDRSKRPQEEKTSPRILFFALQSAMQNEVSRSSGEGFVVLINVSNPFAASFNESKVKMANELMQHSMPIKLGKIHLISNHQSGGGSSDSELPTAMDKAVACLGPYFKSVTTVHVASSGRDCLNQLSPFGLSSEGLPVSFGGSWCWSQSSWSGGSSSTSQVTMDVEPDLSCLVRNALWSYTQSIAGAPKVVSDESSHSASMSADSEAHASSKVSAKGTHKKRSGKMSEDAKAKKRKLNVIYARRKRERERIEIEVLQDRVLGYNTKNTALQDENARLEKLLKSAMAQVDRHESMPSVGSNGTMIGARISHPFNDNLSRMLLNQRMVAQPFSQQQKGFVTPHPSSSPCWMSSPASSPISTGTSTQGRAFY